MNLFVYIIAYLFYLLVCVLLLTCAIIHWVRFSRCRRFPVADGRLLTESVVPASDGHGCKGGFVPKISYSYTVATKRYTSSDIYSICGSAFATRAQAEQFCRKLRDQPFVVYYNPAKPADAFLQNGPAVAIILPLCLGLIFTICGIYRVVLLCHP